MRGRGITIWCKGLIWGMGYPTSMQGMRFLLTPDGRILLLATHDAADAQALNISDIITL